MPLVAKTTTPIHAPIRNVIVFCQDRSADGGVQRPARTVEKGCPSDQAALLQEPHTVGRYRNALWRFTCTYQPATYLCVIDRRIDAVRRVA